MVILCHCEIYVHTVSIFVIRVWKCGNDSVFFHFWQIFKGKDTMANKDCVVNNYYEWINYINLRCEVLKKEEEKRLI